MTNVALDKGLQELSEFLAKAQSRLTSLLHDNKSPNCTCRECGRSYRYDDEVGYDPTICGPMCHGIEIGRERENKSSGITAWKSSDEKPTGHKDDFLYVKWKPFLGGEVLVDIGVFRDGEFRYLQCAEDHSTEDASYKRIGEVLGWMPVVLPSV